MQDLRPPVGDLKFLSHDIGHPGKLQRKSFARASPSFSSLVAERTYNVNAGDVS
ncbi:MAG TPA: hypothetical protein VFE02_18665 [Candidatus Acidoferrales bacterium]|nr:hypothetical protein [Candidatus Acidoferrales bacterium]